MAAYMVVSLITGFTCAAVSFLWYGVPLWAMGLFYVGGCWTGFIASLAVFLLFGPRDDASPSQMHDQPITR